MVGESPNPTIASGGETEYYGVGLDSMGERNPLISLYIYVCRIISQLFMLLDLPYRRAVQTYMEDRESRRAHFRSGVSDKKFAQICSYRWH